MTITISTDSNNDLYIGSNGSLSISSGINAVLLACEHAAKTQLGELMYAVDQGIPNFTEVWGGSPNILQFDAYLRRALVAVDGVESVTDLQIYTSDNKLTYQATIQTIYGTGAING